jgi:hypothetical protein
MSFTKSQDVTDITALKSVVDSVAANRGTRNEARALHTYNFRKSTIQGRSSKNDKRLGLDYIDRMISEGRDANAQRHAQAILDTLALLP